MGARSRSAVNHQIILFFILIFYYCFFNHQCQRTVLILLFTHLFLMLHFRKYRTKYIFRNIARNWAIYPNLGRTIQSCSFGLKNGSHGILEVLIPNTDLDFRNSGPKIHFWANLGPKSQSCFILSKNQHTRYLKDADSYSNISFLNFWF